MSFWILVVSYWLHLLSTIVWLGGLASMAILALPALRKGTLARNNWVWLQQKFAPWANASLILLLVTGFVQMTEDPNYNGFLAIDSLWAGALLAKHIAFVCMVLISAYTQFSLYPAMARLRLLEENRPSLAAVEQEKIARRELSLLRLNLVCAGAVLLFTAVATAV